MPIYGRYELTLYGSYKLYIQCITVISTAIDICIHNYNQLTKYQDK